MVNSNTIILAGVVVIILGILLIFLGTALQITSKSGGTGEVQAGGVVMIGPIPIIFGTNKNITTISIVLAIILMVLAYLLFYRWGFR
ncbi:TIGR00304 family membrane protein [Methanobacterium paludis]|uniref:TIGR00304 family protein n=1 Tax=Methanobacterium paludis (strain DSM 25820 / JCM 18151 / SWAN1) TaxID=868131 RepID=F6D2L4_METPW|nr:TIGR00304 family protein [Methanobacterium paludis]AEG17948.1 protein of unknown function DUF131 [Methanobacterium paludis]